MLESQGQTRRWWAVLGLFAMGNLGAWVATWWTLDPVGGVVRWHLLLSGLFVAACAYRSVLPRIDLERTCMVDHPASSIVAGRTAATVAEVCFGAQVALTVYAVGGEVGLPWVQAVAPWIVPPLVVAQGLCWYGLITRNHLGHAIEESLWAVTFAVVGVCFGAAAWHGQGPVAWGALGGTLACAVYVGFMVWIDVPMYVARWREGQHGSDRLGAWDGLVDALHRREVTQDWSVWRPEVPWLTGYFTGAVWLSLVMVWWAATTSVA